MRAVATLLLLCNLLPACVPSGSTAKAGHAEFAEQADIDQQDESQVVQAKDAIVQQAGLPVEAPPTQHRPPQGTTEEPSLSDTLSPAKGNTESGVQPRSDPPALSAVQAREVLWAILLNTETSPELQRDRFRLPPALKPQDESTDQPEAQEEQ